MENQLELLEYLFESYLKAIKKGKPGGRAYKNLIKALEATEIYLNVNETKDRLMVTFPNDYHPIDVPIQNFVDFEVKSDYESVVFGYVGQGMNDRIYVSMDKFEYLKLQKYKENLQCC